MVLAMSNEVSIVKTVFEQFNTEVDERDAFIKKKLEELEFEDKQTHINFDKKTKKNTLEID
jgi:hypothetical protein